MNEKHTDKIPRSAFLQMQAVYDTLKTAEHRAADFILEYPEKIPRISIVDFAVEAGCSEATIFRLSKRLGYEGFPELKRDFESCQKDGVRFMYGDITRDDTPLSVVKKVFDSSVAALRDTFGLIDESSYLEAVKAISQAQTMMFWGVGDAGAVALEAYQRFIRVGKHCIFSQDPDSNMISASQLDPSDLFLAVSYTGQSKLVIDAAKIAKERGATVIAVTNYPFSSLAKRADIILQTAVFSKTVTGEIMAKRITALCIIESLYINYLMKNEKAASRFLKSSDEVVKLYKQ